MTPYLWLIERLFRTQTTTKIPKPLSHNSHLGVSFNEDAIFFPFNQFTNINAGVMFPLAKNTFFSKKSCLPLLATIRKA